MSASERLWSLWDMLQQFEGPRLVGAIDRIGKSIVQWSEIITATSAARVPLKDHAAILAHIDYLSDLAARWELPSTLAVCQRARAWMEGLPRADIGTPGQTEVFEAVRINLPSISQNAGSFQQIGARLMDETQGRYFFHIRLEDIELYRQKTPPFGVEVYDRFRSAHDDIEEAGKCLALDRSKSCVLHLMLAMEHALREIASVKGVTIFKGDPVDGLFLTWGDLARNLKDEFIDNLPTGSAEQQEWTSIHSLLWSVGKAWRNPTMHPASAYSDKEARGVWEAVKNFLNHLAPLV